MKESTPWHIIIKYLRNNITQEEEAELNKWLDSSKENKMLFEEAIKVYMISDSLPELMNPDKDKAWNKINQRIKVKSSARYWFTKLKYVAVAAVLAFVFGASWLLNDYYNHKIMKNYSEIVAPLGQKTMVVLPDSSLVWLNSGSSLKYRSNFNLKKRQVTLAGEAFFKVHKDPSKRFRVKSGILNIDVYGTEFNVKNHYEDDFQEITVSRGRVGISDYKGEIRQLTMGEQARLNKKNNRINFTKGNPEIVSAWRNNELIFDDTPIEDVIKYLERWYGVNISIDKEIIGKHRYTFKIKTESFYEILEKIKIMTPIEYEINGKDVELHYLN